MEDGGEDVRGEEDEHGLGELEGETESSKTKFCRVISESFLTKFKLFASAVGESGGPAVVSQSG